MGTGLYGVSERSEAAYRVVVRRDRHEWGGLVHARGAQAHGV